jgi:hypothetical protein
MGFAETTPVRRHVAVQRGAQMLGAEASAWVLCTVSYFLRRALHLAGGCSLSGHEAPFEGRNSG